MCFRKNLLMDSNHRKSHHDINQGGDEIIRSATELIEAGIQTEKSRTRSLEDISFRKGVLKLPLIVVDDALESLYLNLIAFESVLQNALGSDKAVVNLFNSLSKDVTLDPRSRSDEVHKNVSHYCQRPWHKLRANLLHNYFTNPWAVLSVVVAMLLLHLTIIHTVYSVLKG